MGHILDKSKLIIIKIGSSLLIDDENHRIHEKWLESFVKDLASLINTGKKVILVTSGAIALGKKRLKFETKNIDIPTKQALASIGQIELVKHFRELFAQEMIEIGQILLTLEDFEDRRRFLNGQNTLNKMLEMGVLPVINENDAIATSEIKIGDNDRLGAKIAIMAEADLYILLSDIDGLYDKNPKIYKDAKFIEIIEKIDETIENMAGKSTSEYGTGGMVTKIMAAKIAVEAGCHMILTDGREEAPISKLKTDKKYSLFVANSSPKNARKKWISASLKTKGIVIVNENAVNALYSGKSLLPVGVINTEGEFGIGDNVDIVNEHRVIIGKGLIGYNYSEAKLIKGQKSSKIIEILGYEGPEELIHRNNMVIFGSDNG